MEVDANGDTAAADDTARATALKEQGNKALAGVSCVLSSSIIMLAHYSLIRSRHCRQQVLMKRPPWHALVQLLLPQPSAATAVSSPTNVTHTLPPLALLRCAEGHLPQAVALYSEALELQETAVFYGNRAYTYLKMENYGLAISDSDEALK